MTKTEIAKALRTIAQHLTEEASLRSHSIEDSYGQEVLCEVAAASANEINSLILKFNAGKMPRKAPVRKQSTTVFYVEETFGYEASYDNNYEASWEDKPLKKKLTTTLGWQRNFDYYRNSPTQPIDLKVFNSNKKLIARFRRDLDLTVTHNKGR